MSALFISLEEEDERVHAEETPDGFIMVSASGQTLSSPAETCRKIRFRRPSEASATVGSLRP
jgi:hypothetical protein